MTDRDGEVLQYLIGLSHSTGRIEAQLETGHRLHEWLIGRQQRTEDVVNDHEARLREHRTLIEGLKEKSEEGDGLSPSRFKEWMEVAKELPHIWALLGAMAWKSFHWLAVHVAF